MFKLQQHAGTWVPDTEDLIDSFVESYYLSLPNYCGAAINPPSKGYYLESGEEVMFKDLPLAMVVRKIASEIGKYVPVDLRDDVYHKVLVGMSGYRAIPPWGKKKTTPPKPARVRQDSPIPESEEADNQPPSIPLSVYETPMTPFSAPRDSKTSRQVLESFMPHLTASGDGYFVYSVISRDGSREGDRICARKPSGKWEVSHTIDDVPVHFLRDKLMVYTISGLEDEDASFLSDKREAAMEALCPDLTQSQRYQYRNLIIEDQRRINSPEYTPARYEEAKRILAANKGNRSIRSYEQAMQVVLLKEAFDAVDASIDYKTPKDARFPIMRDFEGAPKLIVRSVVVPHSAPLRAERMFLPTTTVDRDCDQVRAMVKTFCSTGDWTLEDFREALGPTMTREKLTTFLGKRGDDVHQHKSAAYLMGWEFFNRRQKMGLEVAGVIFQMDMQTLEENEQKLAVQSLALAERARALVKKQRKQLESLRDAQEREVKALEEAQERELRALEYSHMMNLSELEKSQAEETRALEDTPLERLNKRASNGKAGRRKKRTRR